MTTARDMLIAGGWDPEAVGRCECSPCDGRGLLPYPPPLRGMRVCTLCHGTGRIPSGTETLAEACERLIAEARAEARESEAGPLPLESHRGPRCARCDGNGSDEDDPDGLPVCLDCDGDGLVRWEWAHEETGDCDHCEREDVEIMSTEGDGGSWFCRRCYVAAHKAHGCCERWADVERAHAALASS